MELKKTGIQIKDEDIRQGISYARLTDKITPITIITNGVDHRIYDTIKNEPFQVSKIDRGFIESVEKGFSLAAADFRNSIETLIENDQQVLFEIINDYSQKAFSSMIGGTDQFDRPILENFLIDRSIFPEFKSKVEKDRLVFLSGNAFTGKTTFLYQFFCEEKEMGNATLYIDCKNTFYPIFRMLTNFLSGTLNFHVTEDNLRSWMLSNLNVNSTKKINVVFDNLQNDSDPEILKHIIKLKDIFSYNGQRIIICADTSNCKQLVQQAGRITLTEIGKCFKNQKIDNFTTEEYLEACTQAMAKYNFGVLKGGAFAREFRAPRVWRILISKALREKYLPDEPGYIDSVPNISFWTFLETAFSLTDRL